MKPSIIRSRKGRFVKVPVDPTVKTRVCRTCHQEKSLQLFGNSKDGILGKKGHCKKCESDVVNRYNKRNRDKVRKLGRKCGLRKYGLTVEQYDSKFESQGRKCAICKSATSNNGRTNTFPVDHHHETGIVRGILCNRCNMMLGYALDSVELLRAAADYLEGYV